MKNPHIVPFNRIDVGIITHQTSSFRHLTSYSLTIRHEKSYLMLNIRFYYFNLSDYRKDLCIFGVKF